MSAQPEPPVIRTTRGAPDATEVAALTAVLLAALAAAGAPRRAPAAPRRQPGWARPAHGAVQAGSWGGRPHPSWRPVL
uniref:Acyl-CoA carboxylase subunit epsilon n=1 Tax=Streptomyces sp. NBC_00049 TaxID=2903617 RepID=A0AAU2JVD4_9ACTN